MIFKFPNRHKLLSFSLLILFSFGVYTPHVSANTKISPDQKEYRSIYKKGMSELSSGKYKKGYQALEKAIELARQDWLKKPYDYSEATYELAYRHFRNNEFAQATLLYQESLRVWEEAKGKNESDKVYYAEGLSDCCLATGKFSDAERLLLYCKDYYQKRLPEDALEYLRIGENLASVYLKLGNYEKAIAEYESLEKSAEGGMDRSRLMQAQAHVYLALQKYDLAEKLYQQILNDLRDEFWSDNYFHASAYMDMASFYISQGKYDQAEENSLKAIALYEEGFAKGSIEHAGALLLLAAVHEYQEKEVEALLIEALDMAEKSIGSEHRDYGVFSTFLAEYYESNSLLDQAIDYYSKAEKCLRVAVGTKHPEYAMALQNLALVHEKSGDVAKAIELFDAAMHIWLDQLDENLSGLSEAELTKFYESFTINFEIFQSFVLRNHQKQPELLGLMLNLRLATKGFLFQNTQKIETAVVNSQDKHLIASYAQWKDLKKRISQIYNLSLDERKSLAEELQSSIELANELEKELSLKVQPFKKNKSNMDWRLLQEQLQPNEAAAELIRLNYYENHQSDSVIYIGLVYQKDGQLPALVVWPDGERLEGASLKRFQASIRYKMEDAESYKTYWQPLKQKMGAADKLYLSADGVFHVLSLSALWNSKDKSYLCDELTIELVNNTNVLLDEQEIATASGAVLMGFPDYEDNSVGEHKSIANEYLARAIYSDTTIRFLQKNGKIAPLPGTKKEIEEIETLLQEAVADLEVFTATNASEQVIRQVANPRILHIATHGFFLKDQDIEKTASSYGLDTKVYQQNPLMRSGLLLANAEQALKEGGDGVLTAYEAQNLNLDQTELVVLSACETGIGDIRNGEGVYGLHRALQAAGARATIMSLWTVSDAATQKLMTLFYQFWIQEQVPKKEAFRRAQNELRNEYPAPYFWASFVLVGR
ncbi:MAG: CHAT domain-containing protein [Reichenbachiella sp.]|uniref:CHAT domain-containing protein n=1 Tax=Reichenbachiella sp. TaxID=2184521 RepID=UPI0032998352